MDASPDSFVWIDADNREQSVFFYRRIAKNGEELLVYLNFLPIIREDFLAAVPTLGEYEEVFNSDAIAFGGKGNLNEGVLASKPCDLPRNYQHAVTITLPPMGAVVLKKCRVQRAE